MHQATEGQRSAGHRLRELLLPGSYIHCEDMPMEEWLRVVLKGTCAAEKGTPQVLENYEIEGQFDIQQ